jgi:phosphoenolpyruvate phosphomutase
VYGEKAGLLRNLLEGERLVVAAGVNDGLSAKLAERHGFHALWASGLGISAAHAVPDASILSMAEFLQAAAIMNEACGLPVIADCDSGYGNIHNVQRMVDQYERAGIAGVCIEDQIFPKRNSLDQDGAQVLLPMDEFGIKIRAAKRAQASEDFVVIARVEALIADRGQEEAYQRASAYAEAGADVILIHSRKTHPGEIAEFASRWDLDVPLAVVPTNYPSVTMGELEELGIRIVIYANQALRASVRASDDALRSIMDMQSSSGIEDRLASVEEIFELQEVARMNAEERAILEAAQQSAGSPTVDRA